MAEDTTIFSLGKKYHTIYEILLPTIYNPLTAQKNFFKINNCETLNGEK